MNPVNRCACLSALAESYRAVVRRPASVWCDLSKIDSRPRRRFLSAIWLSLIVLMSQAAAPAVSAASVGGDVLAFDIPSQPLISALEAYGTVTGLAVLYDSGLARGRRSRAIKGEFSPGGALLALLAGNDLKVVYSAGGAFAIVPAPERRAEAVPANYRKYLTFVQHTVGLAFCRVAETRPGNFRVALQFSIGSTGEILQPQLLGSSGSEDRDRAIFNLMSGLATGRPPPADMPQPITMTILPRPPERTGDCQEDG